MSNQTFITLSSLAMDLKRAALGTYRGSTQMANRFFEEALRRKDELEGISVAPYIYKALIELEKLKNEKDPQKKAEDALMYSTIFQNYSLKNSVREADGN